METSQLDGKHGNHGRTASTHLSTCTTTTAETSTIAVDGSGFETDPQRTTALWDLVTADMARKASSKQTTQTTSSSTADTPIPGTAEFPQQALLPRNIVIAAQPAAHDPFRHFNTSPPAPDDDPYDHYRRLPGLGHSTVWLNHRSTAFQDDVVRNYKALHRQQPIEAEWVDDALRLLLKREPRSIDDTLPRSWVPIRLHEQTFSPSDAGGSWDAPPVLSAAAPAFAFATTPDCSYWIWAGGFAAPLRDELDAYAAVRAAGHALCPYLSVELKRGDEPAAARKALHQVALAGAIALYNRFQLRRRRRRRRRRQQRPADDVDLRHYGLALTGVRWAVWCITPRRADPSSPQDGWDGCDVRQVGRGVLDRHASVEKLAAWLNEIHRWGNTVHSGACMDDIKAVVRADHLAPRTSLLAGEIELLRLEEEGEVEK